MVDWILVYNLRMISKVKSWLINFFTLFKNRTFSFVRIISDYIKVKKIINNKFESLDEFKETSDLESFEKYFLFKENFIQHAFIRAINLDIDKTQNLSILDLGTGAGYFPFICNYYGNDAESIDIKGNTFYDKSTRALGLTKFHQEIKYNEDLIPEKKYDLICAYMICFNGHRTKDVWGVNEWKIFITSIIKKNLKISGKIFLSFNLEDDGNPFSSELENFFTFFAKKISNNEILIQNTVELESVLQDYKNTN